MKRGRGEPEPQPANEAFSSPAGQAAHQGKPTITKRPPEHSGRQVPRDAKGRPVYVRAYVGKVHVNKELTDPRHQISEVVLAAGISREITRRLYGNNPVRVGADGGLNCPAKKYMLPAYAKLGPADQRKWVITHALVMLREAVVAGLISGQRVRIVGLGTFRAILWRHANDGHESVTVRFSPSDTLKRRMRAVVFGGDPVGITLSTKTRGKRRGKGDALLAQFWERVSKTLPAR